MNLFFLHGFLGRPSDWGAVTQALTSTQNLRVFVPDYFNDPRLGPHISLAQWGKIFNQWVQENTGKNETNILVGYSLGGRLALHALEHQTDLWSQVVLVSTNPGFKEDLKALQTVSTERGQRMQNDLCWAADFAQGSWEDVMTKWNSQPVFAGGQNEPVRCEQDYSPEILANSLTKWSLAQQKDMRPVIQKNADKVLWVVGEQDKKYLAMAQELDQELGGLSIAKVPRASHRVLFDAPEFLSNILDGMIS